MVNLTIKFLLFLLEAMKLMQICVQRRKCALRCPDVNAQAASMPVPAGMRVTPELARQQMEALKRMRPEQLEELAAVAERGGPVAGGPSPADAQRAAEMLKVGAAAQCRMHADRTARPAASSFWNG
jgi:hypothetical protein